jgi:hypothetical protein
MFVSCGKIEQVQDSFIAMSGNNSLTQVDVRIGFVYRGGNNGHHNDFLDFENTQYKIGSISSTATSAYQAFPVGVTTPVYFKGNFAKRSGLVTSNPSLVVDVVDIEAIIKR